MQVNTAPWQVYTLWQFAGDDEDRSVATVDREGWQRLANPTGQASSWPLISGDSSNSSISSDETWTDNLGDTWHREVGRFTSNRPLTLRWGALPTSTAIAELPAGSVIDYDAWSRRDGEVWIRQPRGNGQYGYLPCRNAVTNEAYGTFSE